jgi:acetyl esterase/lipase
MLGAENLRSLHLLDPEIRPLLQAFPPFKLCSETLAEFRSMEFPAPMSTEAERTVELLHRQVDGAAGSPQVRLAIYRPSGTPAPLPTILHIHGGGFVGGNIDASEPRYRQLVSDLGCALVAVDYRLAPETCFPGNVEDCYAALAWLSRAGGEYGIAASRIVLMGESAGGGLSAALALLARDRGEYRPIFQHLVYPMLDDRTGINGPPHPYAGEFLWTVEHNRFGWSSLLGTEPGLANVSPYAAPARATDLSGLAPAFIITGALDLFAEENVEYARRLMQHGVPVELHVIPGGIHGFDIVPGAAIAQSAAQLSMAALARAIAG